MFLVRRNNAEEYKYSIVNRNNAEFQLKCLIWLKNNELWYRDIKINENNLQCLFNNSESFLQ